MAKIKFGVVGQGHIGKRHAEMVRRNPDCELVAVCINMEKDYAKDSENWKTYIRKKMLSLLLFVFNKLPV